jgi:hypothetical protein
MRLRAAVVLLACAQLACGKGGGDESESAIAVTFTPARAHACAIVGWTGNATLTSTAWLGAVPPYVARVNVILDGTALDPLTAGVTRGSGTRFAVRAQARSGLAAGTHDGAIAFELCTDAACDRTRALSAALPYTIEVLTDPVLTVSAGGAPVAGTGMFQNQYAIPVGAPVTITADRPVIWTAGRSSGFTALEPTAVTSTTWSGTIAGGTQEWLEVWATGSCDGAPLGKTALILDLQ